MKAEIVDAAAPRRWWTWFEPVHAVTYFAPACRAAFDEAGTVGFWMGYFAARMAPMGAVHPTTATAVCFGFAPRRVERALPDAWTRVSPGTACELRARAAAATLREVVPDLDRRVAPVVTALGRVVAALDPAGRPLGAANLGLALPEDPVAALWQLCTTLREHRGDAHVALLVTHGLDGCEANVLATAVHGADPDLLRVSRAWDEDEWSAAAGRLGARGLLVGAGGTPSVSDAGRALHEQIERRTDELAGASYRRAAVAVLDGDLVALDAAFAGLEPLASAVSRSGLVPYPNPIGLPPG